MEEAKKRRARLHKDVSSIAQPSSSCLISFRRRRLLRRRRERPH